MYIKLKSFEKNNKRGEFGILLGWHWPNLSIRCHNLTINQPFLTAIIDFIEIYNNLESEYDEAIK